MLAILFVRQILAYVEFEMRKIRTVVGTCEEGYAGDGNPAKAFNNLESGDFGAGRCLLFLERRPVWVYSL
ncbi:MAG: hypothetical protein VYC69_01350 [Chloroflexota bacterium]|nr:hypothetical protein [Chloroflexota bacterium]